MIIFKTIESVTAVEYIPNSLRLKFRSIKNLSDTDNKKYAIDPGMSGNEKRRPSLIICLSIQKTISLLVI